MELFIRIEADALAFFICLVIFVHLKSKPGRFLQEYRMMSLLIGSVMAEIALDAFAWYVSPFHSPAGVWLRQASLFLYYALNDFIPFLWFLYVYLQVYHTVSKRRLAVFGLPQLLGIAFVTVNLFVPLLYSVSAGNVYQRERFFFINAAICYGYMLAAEFVPLFNRRRVSEKHYVSLSLFSFPPLIGSFIQLEFLGLNLIWTCAALSLLIIYLGILVDKMGADSLTGLRNSMQANEYLEMRLRRAARGQGFTAVLLDSNDVKEINDVYGRSEGDAVITAAARLLQRSVNRGDFLARVGGNLFLMLLDTEDRAALDGLLREIEENFDLYNSTSSRPYRLSLTTGWTVCKAHCRLSAAAVTQILNERLTANKQARRGSVCTRAPGAQKPEKSDT